MLGIVGPTGSGKTTLVDVILGLLRPQVGEIMVVAHSMGGLVSRGFLQRYRAGGKAAIPLFVSIATPWDGHKAAELGVKTAPAVEMRMSA